MREVYGAVGESVATEPAEVFAVEWQAHVVYDLGSHQDAMIVRLHQRRAGVFSHVEQQQSYMMRHVASLTYSLLIALVIASRFTNAAITERRMFLLADTTPSQDGRLEGRNYYLLEPQGTCLSNDPLHTRLKTWVQRIEFHNGYLLVWGGLCNDQAQQLNIADVGSRLHVSSDLRTVGFDGATLIFSADPPALCDQGTWCPVETAK